MKCAFKQPVRTIGVYLFKVGVATLIYMTKVGVAMLINDQSGCGHVDK